MSSNHFGVPSLVKVYRVGERGAIRVLQVGQVRERIGSGIVPTSRPSPNPTVWSASRPAERCNGAGINHDGKLRFLLDDAEAVEERLSTPRSPASPPNSEAETAL